MGISRWGVGASPVDGIRLFGPFADKKDIMDASASGRMRPFGPRIERKDIRAAKPPGNVGAGKSSFAFAFSVPL